MKAEIQHEVTVNISMSDADAKWLRKVMRNPLNPEIMPSEEKLQDKTVRRRFYNLLDNLMQDNPTVFKSVHAEPDDDDTA